MFPIKPDALIFDVFGTCVDWRGGVAREVETAATALDMAIDGAAFADSWRAKYQPAMHAIRSGKRDYVDLDILHRENLDATLNEFGIADRFDEAARADLNHAWEKLPPWPDTVPGLTRLKRKFIVAPCSNGSIAADNQAVEIWGTAVGLHSRRRSRAGLQARSRRLSALLRGASVAAIRGL